MSPFIGGGFGGKLFLRADAAARGAGARAAQRPVKVALPRPLIFNNTTHRPATIQRIRIGATQGRQDHRHRSRKLVGQSRRAADPRTAVGQTRLLYAGAEPHDRRCGSRRSILPEGNAMRAPGEAPGLMALEIAMDEMAEKLGIDPIEFRILNDTQVDPEQPERPFSQRQLVECLRMGAERFGWEQAQSEARADPRRTLADRHGRGGRRSATTSLTKSGARVRLDNRGRRHGRDRHDRHRHRLLHDHRPDRGRDDGRAAGQGVRSGSATPRFPFRRGSGGQFGANNSTSGVYAACVKLREAVARQARLQLRRRRVRRWPGHARAIAACRSPTRPADGDLVGRGRHRIWRSRQEVSAIDLRRAFRRSRRRCRDRRNPRPAHARGLRRGPHPQSEDRRAAR